MSFIQRVVCFISPSLVDGTETLNELDKITSNSKMDILRRNLHPALAVYNPKGVKTTLTNIHPNYLELDISTVSISVDSNTISNTKINNQFSKRNDLDNLMNYRGALGDVQFNAQFHVKVDIAIIYFDFSSTR